MTRSRLTLSFEVRGFNRQKRLEHFAEKTTLENLPLVISRLLGQPPGAQGVSKGFWIPNVISDNFILELVQLKSANPCVVINIDTSGLEIDAVRTLVSLKSTQILEILRPFELTPDQSSAVYPVVGYVTKDRELDGSYPREWLVSFAQDKNFEFKNELVFQLVQRVGIERSLYSWAFTFNSKVARLHRFYWAPYTAYRVRRWPVELFADQFDLVEKYNFLRVAFNLPEIRKSILERAKSWWSVAATSAAIIALFASPLIEKFWKMIGII